MAFRFTAAWHILEGRWIRSYLTELKSANLKHETNCCILDSNNAEKIITHICNEKKVICQKRRNKNV